MAEVLTDPGPAQLSVDEAIARLADILGCPGSAETTCATALADYTRARIFRPHVEQSTDRPTKLIHSQLLLSEAKRDMHFLFSGLNSKEFSALLIKELLPSLCRLGDVAKTPGGWRAPGPTRVVSDPELDSSLALVFGGAPTEILQNHLGMEIRAFACSRFADLGCSQLEGLRKSGLLVSIDEWLGGRDQCLESWTNALLKTLNERTNRWETSDLGAYEIYLPSARAGKNWIRIKENQALPQGTQVIRGVNSRSTHYSSTPWLLIHVSGLPQKRAIERYAHIPLGSRLRLLFGLEKMRGVRRSAGVQLLNRTCHLHLDFKLPYPELKILDLGWPSGGVSSRKARTFEFAIDMVPVLGHVLARLGIELKITSTKEVIK